MDVGDDDENDENDEDKDKDEEQHLDNVVERGFEQVQNCSLSLFEASASQI